MSRRVRARLDLLGLLPESTHEERVQLDVDLETKYHGYCDTVVDQVTDAEFKAMYEEARRKVRARRSGLQVPNVDGTAELSGEVRQAEERAYA